jgi:hypothetical protein
MATASMFSSVIISASLMITSFVLSRTASEEYMVWGVADGKAGTLGTTIYCKISH